ncbi:MAG: [LysW]-lysine hydrolase [Caldilineales bacterium]|nr:[LysW]-lysine hydrolase [Caldilineales bacterium]MCW5857136.1 [LysW]-lysine hydrolase [Caldilineales bacterium]
MTNRTRTPPHPPRRPHDAVSSRGIDLLYSLVGIPSVSTQESQAAHFLAGWMAGNGFSAFVDEGGNAVGILDGGPGQGGRQQDIILLGHIDTVGGLVPVRIQNGKLFGRGSVDAKGPLAAFAVAAAGVGPQPGYRIIVIGATEEEAVTSRGAHFALTQYRPALVVIGEPSGWNRITLGYKGRMLVEVVARQPVSHTANPIPSACELAVGYWDRVRERVNEINVGRQRPWDQVLPSLRSFDEQTDGLIQTAHLQLGFRLPPDFGPDDLKDVLRAEAGGCELEFRGEEVAYWSDKNTPLVRAFLPSIRAQGGQPGFVLKTGTSDMNIVGPVWRCPIIAYGPGDSTLDHTPDEHVEIAEWERGVAVLAEALRRLTAEAG